MTCPSFSCLLNPFYISLQNIWILIHFRQKVCTYFVIISCILLTRYKKTKCLFRSTLIYRLNPFWRLTMRLFFLYRSFFLFQWIRNIKVDKKNGCVRVSLKPLFAFFSPLNCVLKFKAQAIRSLFFTKILNRKRKRHDFH